MDRIGLGYVPYQNGDDSLDSDSDCDGPPKLVIDLDAQTEVNLNESYLEPPRPINTWKSQIADGPPALKTGSETHKQDRVEPNIEATRNRTQNKENLNREIQKDAFGFYVTHSCLKQPCVVNILKTQNTNESPALKAGNEMEIRQPNVEAIPAINVRLFKCPLCRLEFQGFDSFIIHLQIHENLKQTYKCDVCSCLFGNMQRLNTHKESLHFETINKLKCELCTYYFNSKVTLTKHISKFHSNKHLTCAICGKHFAVAHSLQVHYKEHIEGHKYSCSTCKYATNLLSNYHQHIFIHVSDKQYKCDICMEGFRWKRLLTQHFKTHPLRGKYNCNKCEFRSLQRREFLRHMKDIHMSDLSGY